MSTFAENSKRLEFNLREIEYTMGTVTETVKILVFTSNCENLF